MRRWAALLLGAHQPACVGVVWEAGNIVHVKDEVIVACQSSCCQFRELMHSAFVLDTSSTQAVTARVRRLFKYYSCLVCERRLPKSLRTKVGHGPTSSLTVNTDSLLHLPVCVADRASPSSTRVWVRALIRPRTAHTSHSSPWGRGRSTPSRSG